MTVGSELDRVQRVLHDRGALWSRAEMLRAYNDGYRTLLGESRAMRRWRPLDVPGRHAWAITQEWEASAVVPGPLRKVTIAGLGGLQVTSLWEVAHAQGLTPSASRSCVTQDWERPLVGGQAEDHARFTFPRNHERVARLEWANRRLHAISVHELDEADSNWMTQAGEPRWWTTGTGRIRSVETFQAALTYEQAYGLLGAEAGVPRGISGLRTWAAQPPDLGWAFAYTTSGEAVALTMPGARHHPRVAYTAAWESELARPPEGYQFTIDYTIQWPTMAGTVVHPWESILVGGPYLTPDPTGQRGIWPHERLDPDKSFEAIVQTDGAPPDLPGLGYRITLASVTRPGVFATQPWEIDQLDGAALRVGRVVGTTPWENEVGAVVPAPPVGTIRRILSPDRQYLPVMSDAVGQPFLGRLIDWRSSEDSVMALEIIVPDLEMTEADAPILIPGPLAKYLRYYVLWRAFVRPGEGRQPILADHYERRFRLGIAVLKGLANLMTNDRVYRRAGTASGGRRPYVRLPAEYPSVL